MLVSISIRLRTQGSPKVGAAVHDVVENLLPADPAGQHWRHSFTITPQPIRRSLAPIGNALTLTPAPIGD